MIFNSDSQVPGSNILTMALRTIARTSVLYFEQIDRPLNDVGQNVTEYAPPITIYGSFQPVQRQLYMQLGLDLNKSYFNLYAPNNILDVGRDVAGDQIQFQGIQYQCESATEWYGIDGWTAILCIAVGEVEIGPVIGFNEYTTFPTLINSYSNFENSNFAIGSSQ